MTSILQSLSKTVHLSLGIAILLLLGLHFFGDGFAYDRYFTDYNYEQAHGLVLDDGRGEETPTSTQTGKNLPSNPQGFSGYTER